MLWDKLKKCILGETNPGNTRRSLESSVVRTQQDDHHHQYVIILNDESFTLNFATAGGAPVDGKLSESDCYRLISVEPVPSSSQWRTINRALKEWLPNVYVEMKVVNDSND